MWQDFAIAIGGFGLFLNTLPTCINRKAQVPILTSLPTALILYFFSYVFMTWNAPVSMIIMLLEGSAWAFIAGFRRLSNSPPLSSEEINDLLVSEKERGRTFVNSKDAVQWLDKGDDSLEEGRPEN